MALETPEATERFSKAVRFVREMRGISAARLAEDAGIGRNTLFLIEAKASNVRLSTVEKLSFYFGVSPARFFAFQLSETSIRKDAAHWKIRSKTLEEGFLLKAVSQNIAFYRNEKGLTQQTFSDHERLAHGHLSKIERTSPNLYVGTLERIAEELVVALPKLLEVD